LRQETALDVLNGIVQKTGGKGGPNVIADAQKALLGASILTK
jgi:hypothetical protein